MGRILAIDYGKKRCGIAVTDPLQMIATSLTSVVTIELMKFLVEYLSKEQVDVIIMGEPKHMDGRPGDLMKDINNCAKKISSQFPDIPMHFVDERMTSKMAAHSLVMAGYKKKTRQQKDNIDKISAVLILQSYLERIKSNTL